MKTLYISDLDGTLLNEHALLSEYTKKIINMLYKKGIDFTIATARTPYTVNTLLKDINLSVPVILMNGVMIYDINKKEIVSYHAIPAASFKMLSDIFTKTGTTGFFYSVNGNGLDTFYENLDSPVRRAFYDERVNKFHKPFTKVNALSELNSQEIVYISISETDDKLRPVYEKIKEIPGITTEYYKDIYAENLWYMEISSSLANKGNSALYLKEKYGYDSLTGFGDNYNDLNLFLQCDNKYAVENARDGVKEKATAIIGRNTEDGVAKWLSDNCL